LARRAGEGRLRIERLIGRGTLGVREGRFEKDSREEVVLELGVGVGRECSACLSRAWDVVVGQRRQLSSTSSLSSAFRGTFPFSFRPGNRSAKGFDQRRAHKLRFDRQRGFPPSDNFGLLVIFFPSRSCRRKGHEPPAGQRKGGLSSTLSCIERVLLPSAQPSSFSSPFPSTSLPPQSPFPPVPLPPPSANSHSR
jgi:hypothetical protein